MSLLDNLDNINDSDSENDEDYVPTGVADESEEDSDAAVQSDGEMETTSKKKTDKQQRKKKKLPDTSRKRKGGICLEDGEDVEDQPEQEVLEPAPLPQKESSDEYDKAKADSLWADFLKDVEPLPKSKAAVSKPSTAVREVSSRETPKEDSATASKTTESLPSSTETSKPSPPKKVTITQEFDFAGETVKVTKEVEAKEVNGTPTALTKRKSGLAGLVGSLSNKKPKMSTLTKSQMDWQQYKEEEGITEELDQYKKGKDGFLSRQAFLHQVDLNQFEIEKKIREKNRSSRTPLV